MSGLSKAHEISTWNCKISVTVLRVLWQCKVQIFIIVEDKNQRKTEPWAVRVGAPVFGLAEPALHYKKWDFELRDTNWQRPETGWNCFGKLFCWIFIEKKKKLIKKNV